jgi:hypothetical protein
MLVILASFGFLIGTKCGPFDHFVVSSLLFLATNYIFLNGNREVSYSDHIYEFLPQESLGSLSPRLGGYSLVVAS